MRRIALLLSILLLLTGCGLVENEYYSVKPHETEAPPSLPAAVEVGDFEALRSAIVRFVKAGQEEGTIRAVDYDGDVQEDLDLAIYEAIRVEPIGAYAVDYLNHDCTKIVNYYEIKLYITYRRTAEQIASVQMAETLQQMREQLERSLRMWDDHLAVQTPQDLQYDVSAMVREYCQNNAAKMPEVPRLTVTIYPESGETRILEIIFTYDNTHEQLRQMTQAIEESVEAAAEYVRYRTSGWGKTQLLYTYLTQRFGYSEGSTFTPVYSALCEGLADPAGLAQGFALICGKAGMECHVVTGLLDGQEHTWNIVKLDGQWRHVDLASCILSGSGLRLRTDWEMSRYYWNTLDYPACVVVEAPVAPVEEPAAEEETAASEQTPAENEEAVSEPMEEEMP